MRREALDVVDAVHRVVAVQAQEPPSPYIALWNRLADFDPGDLDRAFTDGTLVRATLIRLTMHAVDATDYLAFHEAMQPSLRAARLDDTRFTVAGVSIADADAVVPDLLRFAARPRTGAELEAWLDDRLAPRPGKPVWWALRSFVPVVHGTNGGPWTFGLPRSYVAARAGKRPADPDAALPWLVERYLEGFGPAGVPDVAQFAMVRRSRVREALRTLTDAGAIVRLDGPDGSELYDGTGGPLPPEDAPAPPRLMAMWDSVLLAYADRSRIIPAAYRAHVTRRNGDVLATLLVDGYVAGVWRPVEDGIEATAFHGLSDEAWHGLETEARALVGFLAGRQPIVYRRYAHWWKSLPSAEVRVLGGSGA